MPSLLRSSSMFAALVLVPATFFPARPASANSFDILPASDFTSWNIAIDGGTRVPNPDLTLYTGQTYSFSVQTSTLHPFWIKTVQGTGSSNGYSGGGLSANGVTTTTTITFDVPNDAPSTLFYDCGNHRAMTGTIHVIADAIFKDGFE